MTKRKKLKNPLLEKKYQEGFEHGFTQGKELASEHIKKVMIEQIDKLEEVPGIGKGTVEKFKKHFCRM